MTRDLLLFSYFCFGQEPWINGDSLRRRCHIPFALLIKCAGAAIKPVAALAATAATVPAEEGDLTRVDADVHASRRLAFITIISCISDTIN